MVYISQLYKAHNYFIRETTLSDTKEANLNELFSAISKKTIISDQDIDQTVALLKTKLENFDQNTEELATFLKALRKLAVTACISRSEFPPSREIYTTFFTNPDDTLLYFKDDFPQLIEKSKIEPATKNILIKTWHSFAQDYQNPNRKQFLKLEKKTTEQIKNKLSELIARSPVPGRINFSYLPADARRLYEKNLNIDNYSFMTNELKWQEYLKTLSFFVADPSPQKTTDKIFLYTSAVMKYELNGYNELSFIAVGNKKGDCTEIASIYYEALQHTAAKNIKVIYMTERDSKEGHVFISFEYEGFFNIVDQSGRKTGVNFKQLLKTTFPNIDQLAEVEPKYHQDVLSAPEGHFKNLKFISFDTYIYE